MAKAKADGEEKISKRKMVKFTMEKLGDVPPAELQAAIKEEYGAELDISMVASYKSQLKNSKNKVKGKRGRPPGSTSSATASKSSYNVDDLKTIKDLINRLGAKQVSSIVDLLA